MKLQKVSMKLLNTRKMVGEYPSSLEEYLKIATIKELESKDYSIEDAPKSLLKIRN